MNLKNVSASRVLPDIKDRELALAQARDAPMLMEFIEKFILSRLTQSEELSADDSNWVIKRAMKDGRQAELKLLYSILCEE